MKATELTELTTKQAADIFEVDIKTIRNWIDLGRFPNARKLPGKTSTYLIPRSDVDLEQKRRQSTKVAD